MQFCKSSQAVENKTEFVASSLSLVLSYTDAQHQPDETGSREGKMTQQIKTYFHIHQEVIVTTTHFSDSDNTHCWM
jgi:hypothetical protein